ncbi:polysaccharide pyruvyl transferase CsaB [Thalassovita gelatinovora]|uniref:Polysaccharide pyruvyl transferase CsaB n=1 Tax=Thalassovita gelatinovora TaxID=53501 RepID=A0A0P1G2J3_THAGE|nr:polysaccharide pyruvyl transferase family protein [Thalassovita gelatinovora]QIZ79861.1 polysaccharide pyruvyl transferase family protein [Thalassovita gelatinovora]CUH66963.1 polysaccharide pyruvyl transferase CsaB [Thalassovita gelatinovora]SEQ45827.1 Polysaccharide pyruvyl transferase [Thalassovita gelatinovora]
MIKAVLMNDTATRYHHGCARVMRLLVAGLQRQGVEVIARSAARNDWDQDEAFLAALERADLIVINGEGTLHHGKPEGEKLLKVALHPARGRRPIALINALYQDNPLDWARYLTEINLIAARDSDSARSMQQATQNAVRWLPDLSLSAPAEVAPLPRHGVIVGDSVRFEKRRVLARAAQRLAEARFIPTKTLRGRIWTLPVIGPLARAGLYRLYNGVLPLRGPQFEMAPNEAAYLRDIAAAELHITGRFHAVCLSMLVETPFLALSSNASKIERLLRDAGMDASRIVGEEALETPPSAMPYSDEELRLIRAFCAKAQNDADQLFKDIAALAQG